MKTYAGTGYLRYRDFAAEKPPAAPEGETQQERLKRILREMPAEIANNPKLLLKALKRASASLGQP